MEQIVVDTHSDAMMSAARKSIMASINPFLSAASAEKITDIQLVVGETITNCIKHGHDKEVVVKTFRNKGMLVLNVVAESHNVNQKKLNSLISDAKRRKSDSVCDEIEDHGRGIQIIVCLCRKVDLVQNTLRLEIEL